MVWLLTGLWHGASWNFVLWGAFYGILLMVEKLGLLRWLQRIPVVFSHLYLLFVTLIGWTLFYTTDLSRLAGYFQVMFGGSGNPLTDPQLSITFANHLFWLLAALLFGPGAGFAVGAVADMIGGTLSGYAINPLITLGAGSIGLTAGLLWRALPNLRLGLRTQISVFAGHAVGSIVINSLALHLFYNYRWSVLVTRIPNALVLAAVNTVLVRLLLENKTIRGIAQ